MILGRTLARAFVVHVARLFALWLGFALGIAFVQQIHDFRVFERQMFLPRIANRKLVVLISGENGKVRRVAKG